MFSKIRFLIIVGLMFTCMSGNAAQFVVKKIHFDGLQRISVGTALSYLPVKVGDTLDTAQSSSIIRSLYKTGFFTEVNVGQKNGVLIISVRERPVIGTITISGNKKITTKQLRDVLKTANLYEGEVYDSATVSGLEQALTQQYYNLGIYNVNVQTSIAPQERNRVTLKILINEGAVTKIKSIKIIGCNTFREATLLREFSLTTPTLWSFISHSDQYSKEKLDADLEKLHNYYLDRGYLKFKIDTTQVSITPDKKHIYITIKITENSLYTISGFSITGNVIGKRSDLEKLIDLHHGDTFSRKKVLATNDIITNFLGNYGYGMPNIRIIPEVNDKTKEVYIKFIVDPGKRVYVRRINFVGNTKTHEEVMRREMRQQEGSLFSLSKLYESRRRLANLGYMQDVDYKVEPVPGQPDQVDVTYNVKETSSQTANFQAGYSEADKLLYGVTVSDQNFLGTGKSVSVGFNHAHDYKVYNLSYYNPYYTRNGISMQLSGYIQQNDPGSAGLTSYSANTYGISSLYGVPFSDYNRLNFGWGVDHIEIRQGYYSSAQIISFLKEYGHIYNELKGMIGWSYYTLDRAIFPTSGIGHTINVEIGAPLDHKSLEYYTAAYNVTYYKPIIKQFIFHARGMVGYGDGYGKNKDLPFYKNFFVGGIDTVRGFENGSLGPLDYPWGNPTGGNVSMVGSLNLIFPNPIGESIRTSVFVDAGNVYQTSFYLNSVHYQRSFHLSDIRSTYGAQIEWRSPLAPIVFCIGQPLITKSIDKNRLKTIDFSISMSV